MTARRLPLAAALLATAGLTLVACGRGSPSGTTASNASAPLATAADFPSAKGKTMAEIRKGLGAGPLLAPTVSLLEPGANRFGFGLFDRTRRQVTQAAVAIYIERSGTSQVEGPYAARALPLDLDPKYQSVSVKSDPNAAKSLFVASPTFAVPGVYAVLAVAKLDGRLFASDPIGVQVAASDPVPNVGQKAPRVDTPTAASVNGDLSLIDTRNPHDDMHQVNFADVVGKKPVLLLFATPALCQSRMCGPVTDIAQQVEHEFGNKVDFIHMEIYRDNEIKPGCLEGTRPESECFRPQVISYHLPTEPWAFAVDKKGKIAARIEGGFSKAELETAVRAALQH